MIPFLKPKQGSVAGVIIKNRNSDKSNESEDLQDNSAEACAQSLIEAIHSSDKSKVVSAMRDLIAKLNEPEADKPSPHTYEASKEE